MKGMRPVSWRATGSLGGGDRPRGGERDAAARLGGVSFLPVGVAGSALAGLRPRAAAGDVDLFLGGIGCMDVCVAFE